MKKEVSRDGRLGKQEFAYSIPTSLFLLMCKINMYGWVVSFVFHNHPYFSLHFDEMILNILGCITCAPTLETRLSTEVLCAKKGTYIIVIMHYP